MGKHTMTKNPALIEHDRLEGFPKRPRLCSAGNESAALTLLSLKGARSEEVDTTLASATNDGRNDASGHRQRNAADFRQERSSHSTCSSVTNDEEENDTKSREDSSTFGASKPKRSHPLTKMALTRPSLLLIAAKATTQVTAAQPGSKKKKKKKEQPGQFASIRGLPEGRPLPPPPRLPRHILPAAPRAKNRPKKEATAA